MEETNIIDFLKSELMEARCDFKERVDSQESIKKRHSELSGEIAKTKSADELNRIIMIVDSWLSIFDAAENQNLFYLGEVPETYLTNTWKEFVKEWRPKFQQLRDRTKFKVENIASIIVAKPQKPIKSLPKELQIDEAKTLFKKAIEAGFMNSDYSWNYDKGTVAQQALYAEVAGEKLKLKNKFKPFEILWEKKWFAQTRGNSRDKVGKVEGENEIMALF